TLALLLWVLRAAYVTLWRHQPLTFPGTFDPDGSCKPIGTSCGGLTGFVFPWLTLAATTAVFLFRRLRTIIRRYRRVAIRSPRQVVPRAVPNGGELVGRDEFCQILVDNLQAKTHRRPQILVGPAGSGKTDVLVQLAKLCAQRQAIPVSIHLSG